MSIEMPEATIVSRQLDPVVRGKVISGFQLRGCEKLQRIGFVNKDSDDFERLIGLTATGAVSRGNTIILKLSEQQNVVFVCPACQR